MTDEVLGFLIWRKLKHFFITLHLQPLKRDLSLLYHVEGQPSEGLYKGHKTAKGKYEFLFYLDNLGRCGAGCMHMENGRNPKESASLVVREGLCIENSSSQHVVHTVEVYEEQKETLGQSCLGKLFRGRGI